MKFSIAVGAAEDENPNTFVEKLTAQQEDLITSAEEKVNRQLAELFT